MIKIKNLNKYYNKGKSNELHVLNNITIELADSGLIAIVGKSGSGKTTFLNAICGLDKVNSGEIAVDEQVVKKYNNKIWDKMRNSDFGYIFQNYNIFSDKTVYENVAFSLELLGMKDKKEIERRTLLSLTVVGMEKYKNRLTSNLSGGQQQRVAIARAIVKAPKVIIADEPTGNLDDKNTIIIMNILKKISEDRLVLLVTHEKQMSEFYADSIIEMSDGSIGETRKGSISEIKEIQDDTIYLKELNENKPISDDSIDVVSYTKEDIKGKVRVKIIVNGPEIIVKAESDEYRIKYDDADAGVTIVDDVRPKMTMKHMQKDIDEFQIEEIDKNQLTGHYKIGMGTYLKQGFQKVSYLSKFKKAFFVGFFLSSLLLIITVSLYFNVSSIKETAFLTFDRNMIEMSYDNDDNHDVYDYQDQLDNWLDEGYIKNIYYTVPISITNPLFIQQTYSSPFDSTESTYGLKTISASAIKGSEVSEEFSPEQGKVYIDKFVSDQLYAEAITSGNAIKSEDILLQQTITINGNVFDIEKVVDNNNGCVYLNDFDYYTVYVNGFHPNDSYDLEYKEIVINSNATGYDSANMNVGATIDMFNGEFIVKQIIAEDDVSVLGYANSKTINYMTFLNAKLSSYDNIRFTSDMETKELIKEVKTEKYLFTSVYDNAYQEAKSVIYDITQVLFIMLMIAIIGPLIFLYFLMRSSVIQRTKEIGIYRALGLPKMGIIQIFVSEVLAITCIGSIPGWLFGLIIIIEANLKSGETLFSLSPLIIVGSLVLIVLINVLVGCLSVFSMLNKTPREILAKYDM